MHGNAAMQHDMAIRCVTVVDRLACQYAGLTWLGYAVTKTGTVQQ